jgi:hypothetical protein
MGDSLVIIHNNTYLFISVSPSIIHKIDLCISHIKHIDAILRRIKIDKLIKRQFLREIE